MNLTLNKPQPSKFSFFSVSFFINTSAYVIVCYDYNSECLPSFFTSEPTDHQVSVWWHIPSRKPKECTLGSARPNQIRYSEKKEKKVNATLVYVEHYTSCLINHAFLLPNNLRNETEDKVTLVSFYSSDIFVIDINYVISTSNPCNLHWNIT